MQSSGQKEVQTTTLALLSSDLTPRICEEVAAGTDLGAETTLDRRRDADIGPVLVKGEGLDLRKQGAGIAGKGTDDHPDAAGHPAAEVQLIVHLLVTNRPKRKVK